MKKNFKTVTLVLSLALVAFSCKKNEASPISKVAEVPAVVKEVVATASAIDPAIQQKLTDAVKDFPAVKVSVENGELTLTGDVTAEQARKIKMSVDALKLGKVNFKYNIKK